MKRYFYYLLIMSMLTNTIFFIPTILVEQRFNGALLGIGFSVISGCICIYLFSKGMGRFPGKDLPDIFRLFFPRWFRIPYVFFLGFMWFTAGGIIVIAYSRIIQRFVNPEFNLFVLIGFFLTVCCWLASGKSRSILYMAEIILVLNVPFIILLLFKAVTSPELDWDAVRVMTHYSTQMPSFPIVSTATYVFTGYVNWVVFNREFSGLVLKHTWAIPVTGLLVMLSSFLIPIGLHGTIGVESYVHLWVSTADSLRLEFGFIERVIYIFLVLYLSVSLLFVCVTWHVGGELMKSAAQDLQIRQKWIGNWLPFIVMSILVLLTVQYFNEKQFLEVAKWWFIIRYPSECMLVIMVYWLGKRKGGV